MKKEEPEPAKGVKNQEEIKDEPIVGKKPEEETKTSAAVAAPPATTS